jgi:hypothetical protein
MTRRVVSVAFGIAITAAAIWWLVTPEIVAELKLVGASARWEVLVLAFLTGAAVQWLRAWRFAVMTTGRPALPGGPLVRIAFHLNFLNFVLPFRLGELGYPMLMRRAYGQPMMSATGVLLLARIYDLCTVGAILAAMGAALALANVPAVDALLWALAAMLALAPIALVIGAGAIHQWLASRDADARTAQGTLNGAVAALAKRPAQISAIALSYAIWLVFGLLAALAANAVTSMHVEIAMFGAAASNLAFALPVNGIGGLGPAQAAWVAAVSLADVSWTDAVISALALYAVTFSGAILFGAAALMVPRSSREVPRM